MTREYVCVVIQASVLCFGGVMCMLAQVSYMLKLLKCPCLVVRNVTDYMIGCMTVD